MGILELMLAICLLLAAGLLCFILIETDRRIREWFDYETISRQSLGEIDGADIIQALKKEGDK